jgi:hypothetical protein
MQPLVVHHTYKLPHSTSGTNFHPLQTTLCLASSPDCCKYTGYVPGTVTSILGCNAPNRRRLRSGNACLASSPDCCEIRLLAKGSLNRCRIEKYSQVAYMCTTIVKQRYTWCSKKRFICTDTCKYYRPKQNTNHQSTRHPTHRDAQETAKADTKLKTPNNI